MEADLDLADKLRATEKELSGESLINEHYASYKSSSNKILRHASTNDMKPKLIVEPVLQRPATPGQVRQATTTRAVESLAHNLTISDAYDSHSDGFESIVLSGKRLSTTDPATMSPDEED